MFYEPSERIVIFVDALDECDESDARDVAFFLRDLTSSANAAQAPLNVCISRRHYPSITVSKSLSIVMERFNEMDIDFFIQTKFATGDIPDNDQWLKLKREVVDKSSCVFLWASLAVDTLLKHWDAGRNMKYLRSQLREIPEALEDLFITLLTPAHDEDTRDTVRLFQWAVLAVQPLRVREWHHILAFMNPARAPNSLKEWRNSKHFTENDEQLERRIRSISKGLLEVNSTFEATLPARVLPDDDSVRAGAGSLDSSGGETRIVQVIHESVREFFLHRNGFSVLNPSCFWNVRMGHLDIARCCLNYLRIAELDSLVKARDDAAPRNPHPLSRANTPSVRAFSSAGSVDHSHHAHEKPSLMRDGNFKENEEVDYIPVFKILQARDTEPPRSWSLVSGFLRDQITHNRRWDLSHARSFEFQSAHKSLGLQSQVLEDSPALLHYATAMFFTHARLAEHYKCDPTTLVRGLLDIWRRYVILREDIPLNENIMVYCAELGLASWVRWLLAFGEQASHQPFIITRARGNSDATAIIVREEIKQHQSSPGPSSLLHEIVYATQIDLFWVWIGQAGKLLNNGEVSPEVLQAYVNLHDSLGFTALSTAYRMNDSAMSRLNTREKIDAKEALETMIEGLLDLGANPPHMNGNLS